MLSSSSSSMIWAAAPRGRNSMSGRTANVSSTNMRATPIPHVPLTLSLSRLRFSFCTRQHELGKQPNTHPRGSLHPGRIFPVAVRRSRNVQVGPGKTVDELAEEPPSGDASRWTAAAVLHVGNVRLHEIPVILP